MAAQEHGADAFAAPVGVVLLEHEDGPAGEFRKAAAALATAVPVLRAGGSFGLETAFPVVEGVW
jgi:hypothetical protein